MAKMTGVNRSGGEEGLALPWRIDGKSAAASLEKEPAQSDKLAPPYISIISQLSSLYLSERST